jgi:enoyl-CoA hydratase/carnithine racemase
MTSSSAGRVTHERFDHILKITIDNVTKKNAFSPEMMAELSDAFTLLDRDEGLWVGVLCAAGENFTAGLDMPKFFGPNAASKPRPEGNIDPFGLANQCRKVPAGQQIERAMELARIIASNAPLGIQVTKQAGRKFIEQGEQAAIAVIADIRGRVLNTADAAEGIKSFIERRAAVFQGR